MTDQTFRLTVDGEPREVTTDRDASLLHVLRQELGKSGTRFGCGVGLCGACFVLVDGKAAPSCDTPIWSADGKDVVTVEGLGSDGGLHPVQQAFLDEQAAQCGFCVSGVLVSAAALLAENPSPTEDAVVEALDRNLCRCGAQRRMMAAVLRAAEADR
ncbi:MAG: (2Fe-2S)-binding protein [Sporichthyaceae bacterium]